MMEAILKVLDLTLKQIQRLKEFQITYVLYKVVQLLRSQIESPRLTLNRIKILWLEKITPVIKILRILFLITSQHLMSRSLKITFCSFEIKLERGTTKFLISHLAQMRIRKEVILPFAPHYPILLIRHNQATKKGIIQVINRQFLQSKMKSLIFNHTLLLLMQKM